MTPRPFLAAALALLAVNATAGTPGDPGTTGDASDTRAGALPLPDGTHVGYAHSPRDPDWYRAPVSALQCIAVSASGTTRSDFTLEANGAGLTSRLTEWPPVSHFLASKASFEVLVGLNPGANPVGHPPSRPGAYTFDLARLSHGDLGQGDAGTGGDASDTRTGAKAIPAGCLGGSLGNAAADLADVYKWPGQAGKYLGLSFAHQGEGTLHLSLLTSGGQPLAELVGSGLLVVELPATDTYTLAVTPANDTSALKSDIGSSLGSTASSPYILAVSDDPGRGCRPFCQS